MKQIAVLSCFGCALVYGQNYPTESRIQIPEACPVVAKWVAQGMVSGTHWKYLRYEERLGLLEFEIVSPPKMSKADLHSSTEDGWKLKDIRLTGASFTLRALVSSSVNFGSGRSSSESCTVSAALKFSNKDGKVSASTGQSEKLILERLKEQYQQHGLVY